MTSKESNIVDNIKKALSAEAERRGHMLVIRKRHGTSYGIAGDPDLYGLVRTHKYALPLHFEIEVKRPGQKPTMLQTRRIQEWQKAGALAGVATTSDEAKRIVWPLG